MGHFSEHGGVPREQEKQPQTREQTLVQKNIEREKQGLPRLSHLCVPYGMPPTTYQGGED